MFCVFALHLLHILLHLTLFPISSHGFTCFLPPVTPMSWCCMQILVFSNFVASFCISSSHPLLSFLAGLPPQRVFKPYVKTNLSNLFYNLLFLQNRNRVTARTMYSVTLLLQLVVNTHCCVAQYVTRSSTIWTASRSILLTCMVRHVAHLFVPDVAAPWRTKTACMRISIITTRGGHQLIVTFWIEYSFTVVNRLKLQLYANCIELPQGNMPYVRLLVSLPVTLWLLSRKHTADCIREFIVVPYP